MAYRMNRFLIAVLLAFVSCTSQQINPNTVYVYENGKVIQTYSKRDFSNVIYAAKTFSDMLLSEKEHRCILYTQKPTPNEKNELNMVIKIDWRDKDDVVIKTLFFNTVFKNEHFY